MTFCRQHFQVSFLERNCHILIKILLNCVPKSLIDNNSALFGVMAWSQKVDKPLPEPVFTNIHDVIWYHLSLKESTIQVPVQFVYWSRTLSSLCLQISREHFVCPAIQRRRYNVTSSPTGGGNTQNDPWISQYLNCQDISRHSND